jgi:ribosomal protein S18 acetylase RimI-like enzyme
MPAAELQGGFPILSTMLTTRCATIADAALLTAHRHAMFAEMGTSDDATLTEMSRNFETWIKQMLDAGKYVGWVVEEGERAVASAGFFELDWPPHPLDPSGCGRGYLLNFWVDPKCRRQGLARSLVNEALAESKRRRLCITTLHASDAGRPLYETLGFRETNEMNYVERCGAGV